MTNVLFESIKSKLHIPPYHPFLIIDLYFLIPPAIAQIFNPIAELAIPIGIPSKETKSEIEIR